MDPFFSFKKEYCVNDSIHNVRSQIKSLVERRPFDFSENISGTLNEDDSFKLSPKWTFGSLKVFGIQQDMTYLNGKLKEDNGQTIIETMARPNYAIVAIFYFMVLLFVAKLFGINTFFQTSLIETLLAFPIICLPLAGIMIFGAKSLRERFERLMQLNRIE